MMLFDWLLLGSHLIAFSLGLYYGIFALLLRILLWCGAFLLSYWLRFFILQYFSINSSSEFTGIILFSLLLTITLLFSAKLSILLDNTLQKLTGPLVNKLLGAFFSVIVWCFIIATLVTINTIYNLPFITESNLVYIWREIGVWLFSKGQLITDPQFFDRFDQNQLEALIKRHLPQ